MDANIIINPEELRVKNPLTVLSVDNYGPESAVHTSCMKNLGVRVHEADNFVAAIGSCQLGASFDGIAINMDMQYNDGPRTVKVLRQMGVPSKLIGFTDKGREEILKFLHDGLDYCLEKPVMFISLAAVLNRIDEDRW